MLHGLLVWRFLSQGAPIWFRKQYCLAQVTGYQITATCLFCSTRLALSPTLIWQICSSIVSGRTDGWAAGAMAYSPTSTITRKRTRFLALQRALPAFFWAGLMGKCSWFAQETVSCCQQGQAIKTLKARRTFSLSVLTHPINMRIFALAEQTRVIWTPLKL